MFLRFPPVEETASEPPVVGPSPDQRPSRRGVTSMEYLVMISFLLLSLILAAQGVGFMTRGLFQNSANATANMNSP